MTDTTILPNVPAYVQLDNNRGYHHNYGISDKDRMHLDSDSLNDALRDTVKDIAAVGVSVEKNGAANQLATEKTAAAGVLATEKNASANQLANRLDFANTQNLLISGFKDGRYDAAVNTAALQAALAECCCEVKELIREDGGKTRDLVAANEAARIRDDLAAAREENLFLRLSAGNGNGNGNNDFSKK